MIIGCQIGLRFTGNLNQLLFTCFFNVKIITLLLQLSYDLTIPSPLKKRKENNMKKINGKHRKLINQSRMLLSYWKPQVFGFIWSCTDYD